MKQEKGITMLSLLITLLIMIVVIAIGINTVSPLVQKSNIEDLTTELMLIQAKWQIERERVNFDGTSIFDEGLINAQDTENEGKLIDEYKYVTNSESWIDSNVKAYYRLPDEALKSMGLELEKNYGYAVNYENDDIIYIPGIEAEDGKVYYKLSEIKGL